MVDLTEEYRRPRGRQDSMKRTVMWWICALLPLVLTLGVAHAQRTSSVKRYPPYSEVWGYEFSYPAKGSRNSNIVLRRAPDGDIEVRYTAHYDETLVRKGSAYLPPGLTVMSLSFFSGEQRPLSVEERSTRDPRSRQGIIQYGGVEKITYSDGSTVSVESTADPVCYSNYSYFLQRTNASGRVLARRSIVYVHDQPVREISREVCDEGRGTEVWERTRTDRLMLIALEDGSFLVHGEGGNYILRFDRNLQTKYSQRGRIVVLDTALIDRAKSELGKLSFPQDAQQLNDKVTEMVFKMK